MSRENMNNQVICLLSDSEEEDHEEGEKNSSNQTYFEVPSQIITIDDSDGDDQNISLSERYCDKEEVEKNQDDYDDDDDIDIIDLCSFANLPVRATSKQQA
jgi:hypothetical protein